MKETKREDEIAKALNDLKKSLQCENARETKDGLAHILESFGIASDDALRRAELLPDTLWHVQLWPGHGYALNPVVDVYARDEEEALILTSIYDAGNVLFVDAADIPANEADEYDSADNYVYLDRTEYGHSCGYLCIENANIEKAKIF